MWIIDVYQHPQPLSQLWVVIKGALVRMEIFNFSAWEFSEAALHGTPLDVLSLTICIMSSLMRKRGSYWTDITWWDIRLSRANFCTKFILKSFNNLNYLSTTVLKIQSKAFFSVSLGESFSFGADQIIIVLKWNFNMGTGLISVDILDRSWAEKLKSLSHMLIFDCIMQ